MSSHQDGKDHTAFARPPFRQRPALKQATITSLTSPSGKIRHDSDGDNIDYFGVTSHDDQPHCITKDTASHTLANAYNRLGKNRRKNLFSGMKMELASFAPTAAVPFFMPSNHGYSGIAVALGASSIIASVL